MLGYVTSYSYAQQGTPLLPVDDNHSLYFQDDWRILPNLTLNVGVRYSKKPRLTASFPEAEQRKSDRAGQLLYQRFGSRRADLSGGGCVGGWIQPKGFLWNRDNNNFQPRFGLA